MPDDKTAAGSTGWNDPARCPYCSLFHSVKCSLVKSYEYHPDGSLKRVEFFAPNDYAPLTVLPKGFSGSVMPTWGTPPAEGRSA